MAEILVSLTIIGIIAAITLPSLVGNIKEKAWETQRKALYSRMSQAVSMLPSLNGYGATGTQDEINQKAAQAFISDGLSKVLQINNICDKTKLSDCGLPSKITTLDNHKMDFPLRISDLNPDYSKKFVDYYNMQNPQANIDTDVAAFTTKNDESIAVFYNPSCIFKELILNNQSYFYPQILICANFVYDLNGKKGPNKVGKDIGFITAYYPIESELVAPMPFDNDLKGHENHSRAIKLCATAKGRLPNIDELSAINYNKLLIGLSGEYYWSSTLQSNDSSRAWRMNMNNYPPFRGTQDKGAGYMVRCIKR